MVLWHLPVSTALLVVSLVMTPQPAIAAYTRQDKAALRALARDTWLHAYKSYRRIAWPADEVKPLSCSSQGHDRRHPENLEVNDVMGDFSLTLVDSLDAFCVLGDRAGFEQAVRETIQHVSFDRDSRIQVFEVTIRMLGGLLSGHQLATNPKRGFLLSWYDGELLRLAHDLGRRLLPAFQTPTGIPYARVHLQHGVRKAESSETCSAGAGSLLLEFTVLSRLTGDTAFEAAARRAFFAIWNQKSPLSLVGNTINIQDGRWLHPVSSTGAGIDSIFEYAAKAHVLMTGEAEWYRVWDEMYTSILRHIRAPDGFWYRGVNMFTGQLASVTVDSLSAFFPGVQTLLGDVESAIKAHAVYAFQWKRYGGLPELFDINRRQAVSLGYPLRPEFIESNMYLYEATRDDYYLSVAEQALHDINNRTRVECGLAAILDLSTGALEDKQPSFVTAETLRYLYLTFDEDNQFFGDDEPAVFTTEGHMLQIPHREPVRSHLIREAPTCPVYDPEATDHHQHFLSRGVATRTDAEHARFLAGYEITDEAKEIREGRWLESGYCELARSEEYGVELLFALSAAAEVVSPGPSQCRQDSSGGVVIGRIAGLRFALTRSQVGSDAFVVSKVGPFRVQAGNTVTIVDPIVLAGIPARRPEHIGLKIDQANSEMSLQIPAIVASFGPSIASTSSSSGSFAMSQSALPLVSAPYVFGCEPHSAGSEEEQQALDGSVLVVHRGQCSFVQKSHLAALSGARAVVVINSSDEEDFVPSAEGDEEKIKALVPLVLVSNTTGTALEALMAESAGGEPLRIRPVAKQDELDTLMLGGYQVVNVKLQRK